MYRYCICIRNFSKTMLDEDNYCWHWIKHIILVFHLFAFCAFRLWCRFMKTDG